MSANKAVKNAIDLARKFKSLGELAEQLTDFSNLEQLIRNAKDELSKLTNNIEGAKDLFKKFTTQTNEAEENWFKLEREKDELLEEAKDQVETITHSALNKAEDIIKAAELEVSTLKTKRDNVIKVFTKDLNGLKDEEAILKDNIDILSREKARLLKQFGS